MKLKTHAQFEKLKKGQWLANENGYAEVTSEYDEFHNSIGLAEVYFDDEDCENYHLENENQYTMFVDVKGSEVV